MGCYNKARKGKKLSDCERSFRKNYRKEFAKERKEHPSMSDEQVWKIVHDHNNGNGKCGKCGEKGIKNWKGHNC